MVGETGWQLSHGERSRLFLLARYSSGQKWSSSMKVSVL
jgi:hypothetical protein